MKKLVVLIFLFFNIAAYSQTASIEKIWVDHNAYLKQDSDIKGMRIHVKLHTSGITDSIICIAEFYKKGNVRYKPSDDTRYRFNGPNGLEVKKVLSIPYYNTYYKNIELFLPNIFFDFPYCSIRKYYFKIRILKRDSGLCLAKSSYYPFMGSRPAEKVTLGGTSVYINGYDNITMPIESNTGNSGVYNYNHSYDNTQISSRKVCRNCNGSGQVKVSIGGYSSSNPETFVCHICNEIMHSYDKHIHQSCSVCHGTGYIE